MKIHYEQKNIAGVRRFWIIDNDIAHAFYQLTKRRTLNTNDINILKSFDIECILVGEID